MKYIVKPAFTLFIAAVITVAALSYVYNLTLEPIRIQVEKTKENIKRAVLTPATSFKEIEIEPAGRIAAVYEGYRDGELVGYVVECVSNGYSGDIELMVGIILPYERISGMRVIRHTETPGLGALAVKQDFYRRFNSLALVPLEVVRSSPASNEIQAITSATITTRAITDAVNEVIEWYHNQITINNEQLTIVEEEEDEDEIHRTY